MNKIWLGKKNPKQTKNQKPKQNKPNKKTPQCLKKARLF